MLFRSRYSFRGRGLLYSLIMGGMMFPVFATIIPVFRMEVIMGIAGRGNRWLSMLAVILPQIAGNLCFSIIVLMGFIQSVPIELEESAYLEGCNVFQIYFHIIIPAAKSSFATVAIFTFLWSYNDLFTQSFFLRYPKEKAITGLLNEISSQAGVNYGLMASSVVLVVIPVLLVYILLQKHIIKGLTAGAIKGELEIRNKRSEIRNLNEDVRMKNEEVSGGRSAASGIRKTAGLMDGQISRCDY